MKLKQLSLMVLVAAIAWSAQAGQGAGEPAREQSRLQKKSKVQQMLQNKLFKGVRAQKQWKQGQAEDESLLKGEAVETGDQPQNAEQTREEEEKKTNINDPDAPQFHERPRDRDEGGLDSTDTILKGSGAGTGDQPQYAQQRRTTAEKKTNMKDPDAPQIQKRPRDRTQGGLLKGNGAGDGDGDGEPVQERTRTQAQKKEQACGEPLGEAKQQRGGTRTQKQLRDGSCDDGETAGLLKGNGAGDGGGEPVQNQTRTRAQKKTCLSPDPQALKVQAQTRLQAKTQTGVDEEEFTPEFLMFLKSWFEEMDAQQQRQGEAGQVQSRARTMKKAGDPQPAGDAAKTMLRAGKGW